jgi:two-component system chemotaxis response regulator CheB
VGQLNPDVITLELDLPVLDGMQVIKIIRASYKNLAILVVSKFIEKTEAFKAGATDYIMKVADGGDGLTRIQDQLIPKIRSLCGRPDHDGSVIESLLLPASSLTCRLGKVKVVVIGVSTGGPSALAELLPNLRKPFPVPILIVQHTINNLSLGMTSRLATMSGFPIVDGNLNVKLVAGSACIAPGGRHMELASEHGDVRIVSTEDPPVNSCRPSIDVTLKSAVKIYQEGVLALILAGMGHDGLEGSRRVKEMRGRVLVQDRESSVVWGMPGAVFKAGLADKMLPLEEMAREVNRMVSYS